MMPDFFVLSRVLHVAAIVGWIGGVWFVTFVVMPAITRAEPAATRMAAFHRIEAGFSRQAKFWVLLAGLSGFWMTAQADLWSRFADPHFWWMHAMVLLWTIFALMLFVLEPLFVHSRMDNSITPEIDFDRLVTVHQILSAFALLTVLGAMGGAHGMF